MRKYRVNQVGTHFELQFKFLWFWINCDGVVFFRKELADMACSKLEANNQR